MPATVDPVTRSSDLLRAVRTGGEEAAKTVWEQLAAFGSDELAEALSDGDGRTAFWLNVYNAVVQARLLEDPSRYRSRLRFFYRDQVTVAGHELSLSNIEHGLLRRSRLSWGLGYLPRPFPSRFERTHRVHELDPRVHFALNCGASSCPPIAAYSRENLDEELSLATASFLDSEVDYDAKANVARVSRLFLWYRGDFGGGSGIRSLLRSHGVVPTDAEPKLRHASYDWSLELDNYLDFDEVADDADASDSTDGPTTEASR